jgi:hypothetical protein
MGASMKIDRGVVWRTAWVAAMVALAPLACGSSRSKAADAAPQDVGLGTDAPAVVPDAPADAPPLVPDASEDGAGDALDANSTCREAIATQCRRQLACRGANMATCIQIADRCPSYYFNPTSNRTVADIQACLPALAAMTCTDISMGLTPPCLVLGTAPPGTACLYSTECQFGCTDGIDECGTCRASTQALTGQACDSTHSCAATDFCHTVAKVCVSKTSVLHAAEGQPCDFAAQPAVGCSGDLVCARATASGTAGTCRPLPKLSEPCAMAGDALGSLCAAGLLCDASTSTCQVPKPAGCGDAGACDVNTFCQSGAQCVSRAAEGQPCRIGGTSEPEIQCVANIWCVVTPGMGRNGVCTKPGTIGDGCDTTHPCAGSLCGAGRCGEFDPDLCQLAQDAGTD